MGQNTFPPPNMQSFREAWKDCPFNKGHSSTAEEFARIGWELALKAVAKALKESGGRNG